MNLSWHFLFHMVQSLSLLAGVGRAMLENGLVLMETRGISFLREGKWLLCTMPNTSNRYNAGNILPTSLQFKRNTTMFLTLQGKKKKKVYKKQAEPWGTYVRAAR